MSRIGREEVERIASLARLRLAPGEAEAVTADLDAMLDYVEQLNELDTRDVPPTAHAIPLSTPLREDEPRPCLSAETAVANAPARADTAFAVPKVLEGEEEG